MAGRRAEFLELLAAGAAELAEDHPELMQTATVIESPNEIADADLKLFFDGRDAGVIEICRGARFNTLDRPVPAGRWGLLSRSRVGASFNAEYLPQLAAYLDAILRLGYASERVLFELPHRALQLDLAVLDDDQQVVVLGEAKRDVSMLDRLVDGVLDRFGTEAPGDDTRRRGDETRQLAWRLWTIRPSLLWLIAPGRRQAFACSFEPLRLIEIGALPDAQHARLGGRPATQMEPPDLLA